MLHASPSFWDPCLLKAIHSLPPRFVREREGGKHYVDPPPSGANPESYAYRATFRLQPPVELVIRSRAEGFATDVAADMFAQWLYNDRWLSVEARGTARFVSSVALADAAEWTPFRVGRPSLMADALHAQLLVLEVADPTPHDVVRAVLDARIDARSRTWIATHLEPDTLGEALGEKASAHFAKVGLISVGWDA